MISLRRATVYTGAYAGIWLRKRNDTIENHLLTAPGSEGFFRVENGIYSAAGNWEGIGYICMMIFLSLMNYFDGTKKIRWYNNITNIGKNNPGIPITKVLIAQENGTPINNVKYLNLTGTSCPSNDQLYQYINIYNDPGWCNEHNTGSHICGTFNHKGNNAILNYCSAMDCTACYYPFALLFGNGASGYYAFNNKYDYDRFSYTLISSFEDISINNHISFSNQIWVK